MRQVLKILVFGALGLANMGSACGADLEAPVELADIAEHHVVPQWSMDGSKIVFSHPPSGVFVVEADGTSMWTLPPDAPVVDPTMSSGNFSPAISSGGSRVAYAEVVSSGSSDIVTSALDGSDSRKLVDKGALDAHPSWSPDGAHIVFYSDYYPDNPTSGLYVVDSDGSNLRSLDVPVRSSRHPPAWSPSGDSIALVAVQWDEVPRGESYRSVRRYIAYTVRPDGSDLTELGDAVSTPAWSPDGTRIALIRAFMDEDDERHVLYTMNPDGSNPQELLSLDWTYDAWYDTLAWSPDGMEILYASSAYRADPSIVVVTVENSEARIVGEFPRSGRQWKGGAAWSPDGKRIAIHVNYGRALNVDADEASVVLYTVARRGSGRRILVREDESRLVAANSNRRDVSGEVAACSEGYVVSNPEGNPGLVQDCETLLGMRDQLVGDVGSNWIAPAFPTVAPDATPVNRSPAESHVGLNWTATVPMSAWGGVEIGGTPPRVSSLVLDGRVTARLNGTIPPELGNLSGLERLVLGPNDLWWDIPSELGDLINLRQLDLGSNRLMGSIPPELGNLLNLRELSLAGNRLTGSIPPELGKLTNLQTLELDSNQLRGSIPPELGNLSSLKEFGLSNNVLTADIPPELGKLAMLKNLYLGGNWLEGSIPPEFGYLLNLEELWLGQNQLTGGVPPELGNLVNLRVLQLAGNHLTGCIPRELSGRLNVAEADQLDFC